MNKDGSVHIGKSPCHKCGRNSEAPSKKTGKPVCFSCYMKELGGPKPVQCMQKDASEGFVGSVDDGIERMATEHSSKGGMR